MAQYTDQSYTLPNKNGKKNDKKQVKKWSQCHEID